MYFGAPFSAPSSIKSKSSTRFKDAIKALQDGKVEKDAITSKFELNTAQAKALELC